MYFDENTLNYVIDTFKLNKNLDFIFGPVKKHWALLHGYKPWKIHFSWDSIPVIQLVSLSKQILQNS